MNADSFEIALWSNLAPYFQKKSESDVLFWFTSVEVSCLSVREEAQSEVNHITEKNSIAACYGSKARQNRANLHKLSAKFFVLSRGQRLAYI